MPPQKNPSAADEVVALETQLRDRESERQAETTALDALTGRLEAGEDVPVKAVTEQRWIIDALDTALGGLRRRLSAARARARLDRLHTLRAEIEASATADEGDQLATVIREATEAVARAITAVESRNARLRDWGRQLTSEGVPPYASYWADPSAAHAGLAPGRADYAVAVGDRRLHVAGANVVDQITAGARALVDGHEPTTNPARLVSTASDPQDGLRWFTTPEDGVMAFAPDQLPAHVLRHWESGYHEISREQARALIDGPGSVGQDVTEDQAAAAAARTQTSGSAKRAA